MLYKLSNYIINIIETNNDVILFNAVSGEVIKLNKELYETLLNNELDKDVLYFNELKQKRFIVPKDQDEFAFLRYNEIITHQTVEPTLLNYVIAPTSACNLRCVYCFEGNEHPNIVMSTQTINDIIAYIDRQLSKLKKIEELSITWFGGEPLLCIDKIIDLGKKLKELAKKYQIKFYSTIITNGVLFTKENALILKKQCNLIGAQITIDGTLENYCAKKNAKKEDFYKLINNVKDVYEDIEVDIRLNTDKENIEDMYKLVDLLFVKMKLTNKLKVHLSQLINYSGCTNNKFLSYGEYKQAANEFVEYLIEKELLTNNGVKNLPYHKLIQCRMAAKNNYVIGPEGELYKCEQHIGNKSMVLGTVTDGLYYNSYYFKNMLGVIDEKCQKCKLYPVCNHYSRCPQLHKSINNGHTTECEIFNPMLENLKKLVLASIK